MGAVRSGGEAAWARKRCRPFCGRRLRNLCRRAGLEERTPHDGRRLHITDLARSRANPKLIAERVGHAKISQSMDYTHLTVGDQRTAVEAVVKALEGD